MMKSLIIYYSWLGNTKVVAEVIKKHTGSDILRIEEAKERKTGGGLASAAMAALLGMQSKLKPIELNFEEYDHIFIGSQVWAGRTTPAINAFIKGANFYNKNIYLFITKANENAPEKVIKSLTKRINKSGGTVVDTLSITTNMNQVVMPEAVESTIKVWIEKASNFNEMKRRFIL